MARRPAAIVALAALVALLAPIGLGAAVPSARATTLIPGATASFSIGSDGTTGSSVSFVDPNGSPFRFAMDGNFSPLVASLGLNGTASAGVLAAVAAAKGNPLTAGYFGNGDGTAEPAEVGLFESLILEETRFLPSTPLVSTAGVAVTLDGAPPTSESLAGVGFGGAAGADTSIAPMTIWVNLTLHFPYSGSSHTVLVAWTLPGGIPLPLPVAQVNVSLSTPDGTRVTAVTGLSDVTMTNDPLGYGPGGVRGAFVPGSGSNVSIEFSAAFPLGDVLILGISGAVVAAVVVGLLIRRRRRRKREAASAAANPVTVA